MSHSAHRTCARSYCMEVPTQGQVCEKHLVQPTFRKGEKVRWYNRSRGALRVKVGTVAFVVPPNITLNDAVKEWGVSRDTYYLKAGGSNPKPRNHESYGVLVQGTPRPALFWPRVTTLEVAVVR